MGTETIVCITEMESCVLVAQILTLNANKPHEIVSSVFGAFRTLVLGVTVY